MKKKLLTFMPLVLIIVIAISFRFIYLDRIPNAITGDELLYVITAKIAYLTGHDITGVWNPLSAFLFRYPPNEQQAELPYFLHIITSGPFPFSLFLSKLPFAALSVGIVVYLYLIAETLFSKPIAIATGLIAAVNPWLVVMGRTGYESTPATFFYLLALLLLLKLTKWQLLWSIIPLVLAFYSYIGTKLLFLPFVCVSLVTAYVKQRKYGKQFVAIGLFSVIFILFFLSVLTSSSSGSRMSELYLPTHPTVAAAVDEIRKISIASPLTPILVNKGTIYIQSLLMKLFRIFSPAYLFVEGDQFFGLERHSFFYIIDCIFIVLGSLFLFAKKRIVYFLLFLFIGIGTIPHIFHKTIGDFSGHLALLFPFMILFTGIGIHETINALPKRVRKITAFCILFLYTVSIGNFCLAYFYEHPLRGHGNFDMRILSRYMTFARKQQIPIILYSNSPTDFLKKYLFYANALSKEDIPVLKTIMNTSPMTYRGIQIYSCDTNADISDESTIIIYDTNCNMKIEKPHRSIVRLSDAGEQYRILYDSVCLSYDKKQYPRGITLHDFAVEKLTEKEFCETFIN